MDRFAGSVGRYDEHDVLRPAEHPVRLQVGALVQCATVDCELYIYITECVKPAANLNIHKRSCLQCSWFLIIFADSSWHVMLSRFMLGVSGGGSLLCIPQFVAEIADDL